MARRDEGYRDDAPRKPRRRDDDDELEDRPRKTKRRDKDDDDEMVERPRQKTKRRNHHDDDVSPSRKSKSKDSMPKVFGIVAAIFLLLCGGLNIAWYWVSKQPGSDKFFEDSSLAQNKRDLKLLGDGMLTYETFSGGFPTNSFDPSGKPLLSWRVHILPYIDEHLLYNQFKLNEPWDSAHNKPLLSKMPRCYMSMAEAMGRKTKGTKTYLRSFSSPGAIMDPRLRKQGSFGEVIGATKKEVVDGLTNTVMIVESAEAVEWTKPDDLTWTDGPLPPLGGDRLNEDKYYVIYTNGLTKTLSKTLTPAQLKALISIAGNDYRDLP